MDRGLSEEDPENSQRLKLVVRNFQKENFSKK
jgi:hypothetical protein